MIQVVLLFFNLIGWSMNQWQRLLGRFRDLGLCTQLNLDCLLDTLSLRIESRFRSLMGALWNPQRGLRDTAKTRRSKKGPFHEEGLVTDVSGPQRNACPGTLTRKRGKICLDVMNLTFPLFLPPGPCIQLF